MMHINSELDAPELNGNSRDFNSRMKAGFILLDKHPNPIIINKSS